MRTEAIDPSRRKGRAMAGPVRRPGVSWFKCALFPVQVPGRPDSLASPLCENGSLAPAGPAAHAASMLNAATMARVRAFLLLVLIAFLAPAARPAEPAHSPLVVVELFTSQGCSSCPPADRYLGELAQEPGVLALSFHIDYWNYIGWTDPFASKFATERQHAYARRLNLRYVYTPQMVVDGTAEGAGSERQTIAQLIAAAARDRTPRAAVKLARRGDGTITIHVDGGTTAMPATLWLVGFDGEHATRVLRGENEGQTLRDYQVVRSFGAVGTWRGPPLDLTLPATAVSGDGGVAVLVQQGGDGRIIGAATLRSPTS